MDHVTSGTAQGGKPKDLGRRRRDTADSVAAKLSSLSELDREALREEWRRLYRSPPPKKISRDLLVLGVAWKIQEAAQGGLSAAMKRRLAELAATLEQKGDLAHSRVARLKPGARLVRTWHGQLHTVMVLEDGFEWNGRRWRSLSKIAREITGTPWSGPRFFGLDRPVRLQTATDAGEAIHA
jgi:hypothetical protein